MKTQTQYRTRTRQTENAPIVTSILDNDFYQFTMGQFAFRRYADVPVKYVFKNRTKGVNLAEVIDERDLRRELDAVKGLYATEAELEYLRAIKNNGKGLFEEDYLNFLRNPQLPNYKLTRQNGDYALEFEGPWASGIYWETPALAVVNELYTRAVTKNPAETQTEGRKRLEEKIQTLQENPDIRFMEFGTRRRFSRDWQEYVVAELKEKVPAQMIGTSNVYLAMKLGLKALGTNAHQAFMILSGINNENDQTLKKSHNKFLQEWWTDYGYDLSIALTDTYGTEFFFRDFTEEQGRHWKGLRQDSGDAAEFAEKQIAFYQERRIDPKTKLFVPSDGLDLEKIRYLTKRFSDRINVVAGWGTNLTNDLGPKALSMVIKAAEANGHGLVKLSDNPAKATGKQRDVERYMKVFGYDQTKYQAKECKY